MAQHLLGVNTVVEEDGNGDTIIKNTANGNEIQLDTIIELIGSDVSLEDDDKLFVGSNSDWSLRYDSAGSFVLRDETTSTDVLTADDGASAIEFARALGTSSNRVPESFFTEVNATTVTATDGTLTESPTEQNDLVIKSYVDSLAQGNDWQESVITEQNDPPASPADGDRYLVGETPTGAWSANAQDVAEWDADNAEWVFSLPDEGTVVLVEDNGYVRFNGTDWIEFGSAFDHGSLQGLTDDDHTQYILVDGTRAFTGNQSFGGNNATNIGNTDTDSIDYQDARDTPNVVADAGSAYDIDLSTSNQHKLTLTQDVTLSVSNIQDGSNFTLYLEQDGTGGHSVTFPTSLTPNGNALTVTQDANALDRFVFDQIDGDVILTKAGGDFS